MHHSMESPRLRPNNLDLIRFFAALQVLIYHAKWFVFHPAALTPLEAARASLSKEAGVELSLVGSTPSLFALLFHSFSGVPIFFVISGFLISLAYERSPSLKDYFLNRFLRVYPGLWLSILVILGLAVATGSGPDLAKNIGETLGWVFGQATGYFMKQPSGFHDFGTGHVTNFLWTIMVELEFYIMVPLLYWVARKWNFDAALWVAFIGFVLLNQFLPVATENSPGWYHFIGHNAFRVFYMFLLGVLIQRNLRFLMPLFEGKFFIWLVLHVGMVFLAWYLAKAGAPKRLWGNFWGNQANPFTMMILAGVIFSFAYSWKELSGKLLRGVDVSYGVYIFNLPIVCLILEKGMNGIPGLLTVLFLTLFLSFLSWTFLEKPALSLKRYSLKRAAGASES